MAVICCSAVTARADIWDIFKRAFTNATATTNAGTNAPTNSSTKTATNSGVGGTVISRPAPGVTTNRSTHIPETNANAGTNSGIGGTVIGRPPPGSSSGGSSLSSLSQDQVTTALKQALAIGVQTAVTNLGRAGGYLDNPQVRIPMPEKIQAIENTLRKMKQDKYADEFVVTMNHAAEQAVGQALPIFSDALSTMTVEDAKGLVLGGNDAATQFFRRKGERQVQEKMLPIVKEATARTGVTSAYKKLMEQVTGVGASGTNSSGRLGGLGGVLNAYSVDIDSYVSEKATDGLFKVVADEEKKIRENPAARTTELLDKVFGAVRRTWDSGKASQ